MPKSKIKTNMERNAFFYLRHLISNDRTFNIPFIIISHIRAAVKNAQVNLPYAHLLCKIFTIHNFRLPSNNKIQPINLHQELGDHGWKRPHGILNLWEPTNAAVNTWIKTPGAKVNQFTDPDDSSHDATQGYMAPPTEPGESSVPPPYTSSFQSFQQTGTYQWMDPPTTGTFQDQMGYLVNQMAYLSTGFVQFQGYCQNQFQSIHNAQAQTNRNI